MRDYQIKERHAMEKVLDELARITACSTFDTIHQLLNANKVEKWDVQDHMVQLIDDCYGTQPREWKGKKLEDGENMIGFLPYNTAKAIKTLAPDLWDKAIREEIDHQVSEFQVVQIDSDYYQLFELENFIEEQKKESK